MTDQPRPEDPPQPRHAGGELIIPALALGFTVYYMTTIWNSPWTAQVNAVLVGSILFVSLAVLAVRIVRDRSSGAINFNFSDLISPTELLPKRLAFAGLTIGYLVAIEFAGFTLSTFVFLAGSILLLHGTRRWRLDITLAAAMALFGYAVFVVLFETRFPKGPFEIVMEMVLR